MKREKFLEKAVKHFDRAIFSVTNGEPIYDDSQSALRTVIKAVPIYDKEKDRYGVDIKLAKRVLVHIPLNDEYMLKRNEEDDTPVKELIAPKLQMAKAVVEDCKIRGERAKTNSPATKFVQALMNNGYNISDTRIPIMTNSSLNDTVFYEITLTAKNQMVNDNCYLYMSESGSISARFEGKDTRYTYGEFIFDQEQIKVLSRFMNECWEKEHDTPLIETLRQISLYRSAGDFKGMEDADTKNPINENDEEDLNYKEIDE